MRSRAALLAAAALGAWAGFQVAGRPRTVALVVHNGGARPVWIEVGEVRQALGGGGTVLLRAIPAGPVRLASRGLQDAPEALQADIVDLPGSLSRTSTCVWNVGARATLWVVAATAGGGGDGLAGRALGSPTLAVIPPDWLAGLDQGLPDPGGRAVEVRGLFSERWLASRGALGSLRPLAEEGDPLRDAGDAARSRRALEPLLAGLSLGLVGLLALRSLPALCASARAARARVDLTRPRHQKALAAALVALFMGLNIVGAWNKSRTYDEAAHLAYGAQVLSGDATRTHSSVVPITALNALPARLARSLPEGGLRSALLRDRAARLPTIATGALLCGVVFLWARALYGFQAGLLALFLAGFAPDIQGHARWVATDLYAAASVTFAGWTLWRFLRWPGWWTASAAGVALGLVLVAKLTGILIYPTFGAILVGRWLLLRRERPRHPRLRWAAWGLLAVGLHLLVLDAAYRFQGAGAALADYELESRALRRLRDELGPLARVPLPLPRPYVEGIDDSKRNVETGVQGRSNNYLLGEVRQGRFPAYYAVALLVKVPLVAQLLFWLALVRLLRRRDGGSFARRELFLLAPIVVLGGYVAGFNTVQVGVRHVLVVLPLGHVLSGSVVSRWPMWTRRRRWLLAGGLLWLGLSVLSWSPHTECYFNELILDRKRACDVLADSNLDWGQNSVYLERYLAQHPEVIADPPVPVAGRVVVGVNRLCGVFVDDDRDWYRRLRVTLEPVDHVAYTHLVYEIPPERVAELLRPADR